jgi:hypothetical protein
MSFSSADARKLSEAYNRAVGASDRTNRDVIFARSFNCGVPCEEARGVTSVKRPFEYDSRVESRKVEKDEQRFLDNPRVGTLGYDCCDVAFYVKGKK